ncbi:calcium-binding protein, partial [Desulfobacula phenolica]|uniref:calcium-binding protein n=1 Tax=Desulfobacula phenolica TaxID=90732 RepID=UPI0011143C8E
VNVSEIYGSAYNDTLTVDVSDDDDVFEGMWFLWGGDGADSLTGTFGESTMAMYLDSPDSVNITLAEENVIASVNDGWGNTDTLLNIHGVSGSDYNDTLSGSANNDGFFGTFGNDTINGSGGDFDWISYAWLESSQSYFDGVNIFLDIPIAIGLNINSETIFTDTLSGIENAWGSDYNDIINGSAGNNWLGGGDGDDQICGGDGHDRLFGDQGNDFLDGGDFFGVDPGNYVVYKDDPGPVTVLINYDSNGNYFTDSTATDGWGDTDTLTNISHIIGSEFDDNLTITITDGQNISDLDWYMWGMDGEDTLTGTFGERTMAMYLDDPDSVTVDLAATTATDGWGNTDTLNDIQGVSGSNFDDFLYGSTNEDGFFATFGNDTIDGREGSKDWVDYSFLDGQGDFFSVDIDLSTIVDTETTAYAKGLKSDGSTILFTDTLKNVEDVHGSAQADKIMGSSADNWLSGNDGNDILNGYIGGVDTLEGGAGSDTFEFMDAGAFGDFSSSDIIVDFDDSSDVIRFMETDLGFSADGEQKFTLVANGASISPTDCKVVGVMDTASADWADVVSILNVASITGGMTGDNDDTYFFVSNGNTTGSNSRIYYWDGDTDSNDSIDAGELKLIAELQDIDSSDFSSFTEAHFDIYSG